MTDETVRRGRVWGLVLAIVAEVVLGFFVSILTAAFVATSIGLKPTLPVAGIFVAQTVILAVLVWLVLYFTFIRSRAPRRALVYFLILLAVSAAMDAATLSVIEKVGDKRNVVANENKAAQLGIVLGEIDKTVATLSTNGGAVDLHTSLPGAPGALARAAKVLLHGVFDAQGAYATTLQKLDYPRFLLPARFAGDRHFARTRGLLEQVRAAGAARETAVDAAIAVFRAQLAGAAIDAKRKQEALDRFDKRIAGDKARRLRRAKLEHAVLDEFAAMIADLDRTAGGWTISKGSIVFLVQTDLDRYQAHGAKVLALEHEKDTVGAPADPPN